MRPPKLHFDGAPDRFSETRKLFNTTSTLRVKYAAPIASKFRLTKLVLAVQQWRQRHAA